MIDTTDRPERPAYGSLHAPPADLGAAPRRRPILPWLVAAIAVAFAIGLVANPWFEQTVRSRLPGLRVTATEQAASQELVAMQARLDSLEARAAAPRPRALNDPAAPADVVALAEGQAALETRLAELQAQVAELRGRTDSTAAAAAEGAERAQTALLVTALRRATDAGQRLDAYEPALRARFAATHGGEVAAVLALGRRPITGEQLAQQLLRQLPQIERSEAEGRSWWQSFKRSFGGVVAVRRSGAPATDAAGQLRLAAARVEAGDVDGALRTVAMLPPAMRAQLGGWIAEARRFVVGHNALDTLEAAALNPAPAPAAPVAPTTL
jgi:hypothetical protein